MPTTDVLRKQFLLAEIIILCQNLNEAGGGATVMNPPSQKEVDDMTVAELETMKRELRDLSRTLGGVKNR